MDAYRFITTIIWQRKKDIREIEVFEKYSQKKVYVEIVYNTFCVCV